ncbi:hypothetical protein StoSoilB5_21500 [Arthrobacter sp. StoSoilB5]|nr:hypothetical protein StoSoilB5_21500 [Arthrobacter sp. StoSoilB5]
MLSGRESEQRCQQRAPKSGGSTIGAVRKESPDPTHLRSVDGSDATAADTPKDVPAEPGTSNDTDDPGRKVMSPATENCMKW